MPELRRWSSSLRSALRRSWTSWSMPCNSLSSSWENGARCFFFFFLSFPSTRLRFPIHSTHTHRTFFKPTRNRKRHKQRNKLKSRSRKCNNTRHRKVMKVLLALLRTELCFCFLQNLSVFWFEFVSQPSAHLHILIMYASLLTEWEICKLLRQCHISTTNNFQS